MTATPSMLMYSSRGRHYVSASNLIDAIFAHKKSKIVVERNRFNYVPGNGQRKMVIRLKRFSN